VTDNTRPSYPNPTVVEALCEIGFEAEAPRFATDFIRVWPHFQEAFPNLEVHTDLLTSAAGGVVAPGPPLFRTRFSARRESRPVVVQFAPGVFAVSTLAPYLGWVTFRKDIEEGWQAVQSEWSLLRVNRIVVRYINRVPLPSGSAAEGWLQKGDYVARALVEGGGQFHSRVQTGTGTPELTTVSAWHQAGTDPAEAALVVDMERSLEGEFAADLEALLGQIDALHDDVWRVFTGLKGPRWDDVLEGKKALKE